MPNNYTLDVQDSVSVESWKTEVQQLNERTEKAVKEAGEALSEFKQTAEGSVFDEVCNFSSQIITSTTEVMKGMTELLNAITKFVNLVKSTSQDLLEGVVDVIRKTF